MSGDAQLDAMIARLRALPQAMRSEAMPELERVLVREVRSAVSAQRSPDGAAWKATKDGRTPLRRAAEAITSARHGLTLALTLGTPEAYHHFGTAHVPQRRILPTGGLPATIAEAFKAGLIRVFDRRLRGGR